MFTTFMPSDMPRQTRKPHTKSRGGCFTCKQRKLKCDEVKPICRNCLTHFSEPQNCTYPRPKSPTDTVRPRRLAARPVQAASEIEQSSSVSTIVPNVIQTSLSRSVSPEKLDPFHTYPESRIPEVDELMKYYLRNAVYEVFPWQQASETNPTIKFYIPLVWGDSVLFHAILQLSAMRLRKARAKIPAEDPKQIPAECIRLLRHRIETSSTEKGASDETISAVATLTGIEHERGNLKMMRMHLEGLKRMLDVRGGLSRIRETNAMVANNVFWAFAVAAYEQPYPNLDPVLPPFFPSNHGLLSARTSQVISHFQDFGPQYESSQALELQALGVNQNLASVVNSIQHISQLIPTSRAYATADTSLVILTRMCNILSYLLSMGPIIPESPNDMGGLVSESLRLSTLLHVFTPWRGLAPDGTLTINNLVHQLITSVKLLFLAPLYSQNLVVLWILCTGASASDKMPERQWFVGHLVEMVEDMGIETWDEMKALVSRVIWHERLCGKNYMKLWGEIELSRKGLESI